MLKWSSNNGSVCSVAYAICNYNRKTLILCLDMTNMYTTIKMLTFYTVLMAFDLQICNILLISGVACFRIILLNGIVVI
jgi:hypothetical protein